MLQIGILAMAGVFGAVLRQVPSFALHDPSAYAEQMAQIHAAYDPLTVLGFNVGPGMVDIFERLGLFRVFSAPWFVFLLTLLVVSIVVCTLDRTPDLWRSAHRVRVVQAATVLRSAPRPSCRVDGADAGAGRRRALREVLHGSRYRVREESRRDKDSATPILDRLRRPNQYLRLATLFTHLGLILFLAGAAITTALGFETVVFLGEGDAAPVQAVGTPDNLLVKNIHFEAPTRSDGSIADFVTDLAVYRNGEQIARKTIRVNDPLEVDGYVFHQNTFGPAVQLTVHDFDGRARVGRPCHPRRPAGRPAAGLPDHSGVGPWPAGGARQDPGGTVDAGPLGHHHTERRRGEPDRVHPAPSRPAPRPIRRRRLATAWTWSSTGAYTGMVIKRDPGQGLIWIAFLSLITGLVLSFYFPRRRVWARISDGRIELALLADRYVNAEHEFDVLLERLTDRIQ